MKFTKVRTYIENCGTYKEAQAAIISGGICFAIPFRCKVDFFYDETGKLHEDIEIELVNVHFQNQMILAVPMCDFSKLKTSL